MLKFAITGNIASGKSAVEKVLTELDYKVFDTDLIAHKVLKERAKLIIDKFSDFDICENGEISRKKLGAIIFTHPDMKILLEDIVHPAIKQELTNIFEQHKAEKFVFVSVPLLFEVNWQNMFDKIIMIRTDDKIRMERLMKRNNLTEQEALIRMNSQMPQEKKAEMSDFIICNNDDITGLKNKIERVIISLEDNGENQCQSI